MKKLYIIIVIVGFLVSTLQAQDLKEILDNYYKSNGRTKINQIKTMTITGTIFQMGSEFSFKRINTRPDKFYLEADIMGQKFVQAYNGIDGWMIAPWTGSVDPQDIPVNQLKVMKKEADFDGALYNYEAKGIILEYAGIEKVNGADAFKIKATYQDDDVVKIFIGVDSNLIIKTEAILPTMMGTDALTETFLSNYKMIEGTAVAFSIETKSNGQTSAQIKIDHVEYDKKIDNNIFNRPKK
ncbi:MAG: outer membrane lipoprotein-sorting protein [Bacteroidetes bacterium]|nr:outer membrane lipoprotein-sorting protein [Bacteroidota bacterium]